MPDVGFLFFWRESPLSCFIDTFCWPNTLVIPSKNRMHGYSILLKYLYPYPMLLGYLCMCPSIFTFLLFFYFFFIFFLVLIRPGYGLAMDSERYPNLWIFIFIFYILVSMLNAHLVFFYLLFTLLDHGLYSKCLSGNSLFS